jgi:hypothetical protein
MGRFDQLFKKMGDVADPQIQAGDETATADNPRNWVSGKVNNYLPDGYQIPLQTVAEDKQFLQNLPETMAGGTMGSIKNVGVAGKMLPHAEVMAHPEMKSFLSPEFKAKFKAENPHPTQYDAAKQALINKIQKGQ